MSLLFLPLLPVLLVLLPRLDALDCGCKFALGEYCGIGGQATGDRKDLDLDADWSDSNSVLHGSNLMLLPAVCVSMFILWYVLVSNSETVRFGHEKLL